MTAEERYWRLGDFIFDAVEFRLWTGRTWSQMDDNEGKLLTFLVQTQAGSYDIHKIKKAIWGDDEYIKESSLRTRVSTAAYNLRAFFGDAREVYLPRHQKPIRLAVKPQPLPSSFIPELLLGRPVAPLTPREPKDEPPARRLWLNETALRHNRALHDLECAWTLRFPAPKRIRDFSLTYREDAPSYEDLMPPLAAKAFQWWCETTRKENELRVARLEAEPLGLQVRLVGMRFAHYLGQKYQIDLAPAKFLHYVAIQQNLWSPELHSLRQHVFENALRGINQELPLMLPCTFALHMAAISGDQKAVLRQRDNTPLYPLAWEAGSGELMHGPEYTKFEISHHEKPDADFPHFNDHGKPDLALYCRNTVREELSYDGAKDDDFRIYGIAVEWRTLAPKLIVVYQSDAPIDELVEGAQRSPEPPRAVSAIDLSADGITNGFTNGQYPTWGPTSKLALLLALTQISGDNQVEEVQARMDELDPLPTP